MQLGLGAPLLLTSLRTRSRRFTTATLRVAVVVPQKPRPARNAAARDQALKQLTAELERLPEDAATDRAIHILDAYEPVKSRIPLDMLREHSVIALTTALDQLTPRMLQPFHLSLLYRLRRPVPVQQSRHHPARPQGRHRRRMCKQRHPTDGTLKLPC